MIDGLSLLDRYVPFPSLYRPYYSWLIVIHAQGRGRDGDRFARQCIDGLLTADELGAVHYYRSGNRQAEFQNELPLLLDQDVIEAVQAHADGENTIPVGRVAWKLNGVPSTPDDLREMTLKAETLTRYNAARPEHKWPMVWVFHLPSDTPPARVNLLVAVSSLAAVESVCRAVRETAELGRCVQSLKVYGLRHGKAEYVCSRTAWPRCQVQRRNHDAATPMTLKCKSHHPVTLGARARQYALRMLLVFLAASALTAAGYGAIGVWKSGEAKPGEVKSGEANTALASTREGFVVGMVTNFLVTAAFVAWERLPRRKVWSSRLE